MATISEDYVSFETAELLKEKGFNEICCLGYNKNREYFPTSNRTNSQIIQPDFCFICCPTLQMAMKWLREVHNIFVCIIPSEVGAGVMDYTYVLYKVDAKNFYFEDLGIQGRAKNISEISYEKACESAIKYCLENLI